MNAFGQLNKLVDLPVAIIMAYTSYILALDLFGSASIFTSAVIAALYLKLHNWF